MKKTIEMIEPVKTSPEMSAWLKANGWDGVVYTGIVVTSRSERTAVVYRNAITGEYIAISATRRKM